MMLSSMFTRILPQKQQKFDFVWKKFKLQVSLLFLLFASLTLSYFSCTPWLSSPWARHISLISTDEKKTQKAAKIKKQLMNRRSGCKQTVPLTLVPTYKQRGITHSIHQASERGRLQHQSVEHLVCLLSDIQQHCRQEGGEQATF